MTNNRGGARPGAGRKSNAQIEEVRALLSEVVTEQNWKNMIKSLVKEAEYGDLKNVAFLLALRYGVTPASAVSSTRDAPDADAQPPAD